LDFCPQDRFSLHEYPAVAFHILIQQGSHEIWLCPNGVSVAVNNNCKSRHTANSILKDAEIAHRF
jgi:predicted RNA binding protein YcfA (HicA-like mRNA interferase family)